MRGKVRVETYIIRGSGTGSGTGSGQGQGQDWG